MQLYGGKGGEGEGGKGGFWALGFRDLVRAVIRTLTTVLAGYKYCCLVYKPLSHEPLSRPYTP